MVFQILNVNIAEVLTTSLSTVGRPFNEIIVLHLLKSSTARVLRVGGQKGRGMEKGIPGVKSNEMALRGVFSKIVDGTVSRRAVHEQWGCRGT